MATTVTTQTNTPTLEISLDQLHITQMHDLSVLLTHPDFRQGVVDAQKGFLYEYEGAPLSLDEMIYEVDESLSRRADREWHAMFDGTNLEGEAPYLWRLGCAFGMINEGLAYGADVSSDVDLSQLLSRPDFLQGVSAAQQGFFYAYAPAPLTEDEMIEEVETGLSQSGFRRGNYSSYFEALGYVFGTINEGLAYTSN